MNNSKVLDNGFKKAKEIIRGRMLKGLIIEADKLAVKAYETYESPKMGFTGQTWTGTAVGVYIEGNLEYVVTTRNIGLQIPPVRNKLRNGESVFLKEPYGYLMGKSEGNRWIMSIISSDGVDSEKDAIDFLQSHKNIGSYGITVVNGSEYANYIENIMGGDVIIGTYHYAGSLRAVDLSSKQ